MPTILRLDGYRFLFFSNENDEPPHIHVEFGDKLAKYWLEPGTGIIAARPLSRAWRCPATGRRTSHRVSKGLA